MESSEYKSSEELLMKKLETKVFFGKTATKIALILSLVCVVLGVVSNLARVIYYVIQGTAITSERIGNIIFTAFFLAIVILSLVTKLGEYKHKLDLVKLPFTPNSSVQLLPTILMFVVSIMLFIRFIIESVGNVTTLFNLIVLIPIVVLAVRELIDLQKIADAKKTLQLLSNDDTEKKKTEEKNEKDSVVAFAWGLVASSISIGLIAIGNVPYITFISCLAVAPIMLYSYVFGWKKAVLCAIVISAFSNLFSLYTNYTYTITIYATVAMSSFFQKVVKNKYGAILIGSFVAIVVQSTVLQANNYLYVFPNVAIDYNTFYIVRAMLLPVIGIVLSTILILLFEKSQKLRKVVFKIQSSYNNGAGDEYLSEHEFASLGEDESVHNSNMSSELNFDEKEKESRFKRESKKENRAFKHDNSKEKRNFDYDTQEEVGVDDDYLSKYDTNDKVEIDKFDHYDRGEVSNGEVSNGEVSNGGEVDF